MTSTTVLANQYHQDLRAPLFNQLGKRIGRRWRRLITLLLCDIFALLISWQVTAGYDETFHLLNDKPYNLLAIASIVAFQISVLASKELYQAGNKRRNYVTIAKTLTFSHLLILLVVFYFQPSTIISKQSFIISWFSAIALVCIGRYGIDFTIKYFRQQGLLLYPIYLISYPKNKIQVLKLLEKEQRYYLVGWADANTIDEQDDLLKDIYTSGITDLFICSWKSINSQPLLYHKLKNAGINLHVLPNTLESIDRSVELEFLGKTPTFKVTSYFSAGSDFLAKRCFDFCFALIFILLILPVYFLIAVLIKIDSSGSIFYRQVRIGLHGQEFQVWKFRTMVADADQMQKKLETSNEMKDGVLFKIKDDPRITRIGKFLREYSLDELPQLFNVLRGEMSLVGPRPLPLRDVEKFAKQHFIRQEVLPGITGLWQVSGRSDISNFDEVVSLDVKYMENWSLWLDIQILLKTIAVVLGRKGAY